MDCEKAVVNGEVNKLDDLKFLELTEKTYNLWHYSLVARRKMLEGDRPEAMRLLKSIGKEMQDTGEYLKKLVF